MRAEPASWSWRRLSAECLTINHEGTKDTKGDCLAV
jgi:hypothetical protein